MPGEIQTLAMETEMSNPRRVVTGIDTGRVATILAVLTRRAGIDLMGHEVYAATVGGMKISEPAADLATALALASTRHDKVLPDGLVAVGELGLGGEVRRVPDLRLRLSEAARLGFTSAIVPASTRDADRVRVKGLRIIPVRTLGEALEQLGLAKEARRKYPERRKKDRD
jgi:DNA repair protein RadA/Sms